MQLDEVRSGGSYLSQSDLRIHFGLAGHEKLDKLEIFWPSGKVETLTNLAADRSYLLKEGRAIQRAIDRKETGGQGSSEGFPKVFRQTIV